MDSRDLTKEQAEAIFERLRPMVLHLQKLQTRMDAREFPEDDELYKLVAAARRVMEDLIIAAHNLQLDELGRPK